MPRFKITQTYVVDAESRKEAGHVWGSFPYDILTEINGVEAPMEKLEQPKTMAQKVVATTTAQAKDAPAQTGMTEKTPNCPDHQVAMQKRESKYPNGKPYWSCPEKVDGKYCRAKPQ